MLTSQLRNLGLSCCGACNIDDSPQFAEDFFFCFFLSKSQFRLTSVHVFASSVFSVQKRIALSGSDRRARTIAGATDCFLDV